jgi:hypothetical protein
MIKIIKNEHSQYSISMDKNEMLKLMLIISALSDQTQELSWDYSGDPDLDAASVDEFIGEWNEAVKIMLSARSSI